MKKVLGVLSVLLWAASVWAVPTKYTLQADTTYVQAGDLLKDDGQAQFDSLTATGPTTLDSLTVTGPASFDSITATGPTNLDSLTVTGPTTVDTLTSTSVATLDTARIDSLTVKAGGKASFGGATISDLGTVTTADINGGTVDGATVGGASAAAGTFTALTSTGKTTLGDAVGDTAKVAACKVVFGGADPKGAGTTLKHIELSDGSDMQSISYDLSVMDVGTNFYVNAANSYRYFKAGTMVSRTRYGAGGNSAFQVGYAKAGLADSAITFTTIINADTLGVVTVSGDLKPGADNTNDLGSAAASWDSCWLHVAAVVGDMPWLDEDVEGRSVDDVADLCAIAPSSDRDPSTGLRLIDDSTLPSDVVLTYADDAPARIDSLWEDLQVPVDSTVASYNVRVDAQGRASDAEPVYDVTYRTKRVLKDVVAIPEQRQGEPILSPDGKPYINLIAMDGKLAGAIRQQAATIDSLRARISDLEAWKSEVEERLSKLESR